MPAQPESTDANHRARERRPVSPWSPRLGAAAAGFRPAVGWRAM